MALSQWKEAILEGTFIEIEKNLEQQLDNLCRAKRSNQIDAIRFSCLVARDHLYYSSRRIWTAHNDAKACQL